MSRRHTVTEDELEDFLEGGWSHFAGSHGKDSDKSFEVHRARQRYRVLDHGVGIYEGDDKAAAIRAYNEAR